MACTLRLAAAQAGPEYNATNGMVWIPAGEFQMGSSDGRFADAQPVHRVWVDGFWMDQTEVNNAAFAQFVRETHYVTTAERAPDPKDFPGVPPDKLVAGSICFRAPTHANLRGPIAQWWTFVPGANWQHPEGPGSDLKDRQNEPVVHVTYEDAEAFAKWAHKRLPTEAEWERAARGGLDQNRFVWGNEFKPGGKLMANTFQGHFPERNSAEDGFAGVAPVGTFPANQYGLFDMAGNVWEWCSDWYSPTSFANGVRASIAVNPHGPAETESFDPNEPGVKKRVQKGGSFLCTDQYCARYMPGARGQGEPGTSTNHVGFRCVMTPSTATTQPSTRN